MKPFDLEKALAGEPVVTRSGKDATQLHLFDADSSYPLMAVVDKQVRSYTKDGQFSTLDKDGDIFDLFMKSKTVVKWVILEEGGYWYGYHGEDEAESFSTRYNCIGNKAHRIEWEE